MRKPSSLALATALLLGVATLLAIPFAQGQEPAPLQGGGEVHGTLNLNSPVLVRIPADLPAQVRKNAEFSILRDGVIPQELRDVIYMEYAERACDPAPDEFGRSNFYSFNSTFLNGIRTDVEHSVIGQTQSAASGWTYCVQDSSNAVGPTTTTPPSAVDGAFLEEPGALGSIKGNYCGGYTSALAALEGKHSVCTTAGSGGATTGTISISRLWITYAKICGPPFAGCREYGVDHGGAVPLTARAQLTFAGGNCTPDKCDDPVASQDPAGRGLLVSRFLYSGMFQYGPTRDQSAI